MATPTYAQLVNLSSSINGLVPETLSERLATLFAILASGQNPDGTTNNVIVTTVPVVADGVTDNAPTIQAAMNAMQTFGGTIRVSTPTTGNKVALSTDLLIPKNVTLEADVSTTKLWNDESTGLVFVPTAGYVSTTIATDNTTATLAAVGGASLNYTITRSSGSYAATFLPGQIITITASDASAVPVNCQITNVNAGVITVTGNCTAGGANGVTSVTAKWGSLIALVGDYARIRRVSADAGSTVPRAIVFGMGLRNYLEYPDAHGGTLAALDGVASTGGSLQPTLIHPNSEVGINQQTTYVRQYGPYSARFQCFDVELNGGRLIRGTKSFCNYSGASIAVQANLVHFTDATKGGPNVELGTTGVFTNCELDGVNGNTGVTILQHLSQTETGGGVDAGQTEWYGTTVIPDMQQVPLLTEDATRSSVTMHGLNVLGSAALQLSTLVTFTNGTNLGTDIDNVNLSTNLALANAAVATTTAVGSNGVAASTFAGAGVLNVASAAAFPTTGTLLVEVIQGGFATVTYTNTTGTTFTGCTTTAGSGNFYTAGAVNLITLITAGSNGVVATTFTQANPGTLNVASTANFPTSGQLMVTTSSAQALLSYTGTTGTTFTGCIYLSGGGTFQTNGNVNLLVLYSGGSPGRQRNITQNNGNATQIVVGDTQIPFFNYPANPATTVSATLVMAGLGILYTPTMYSALNIDVWGLAGNATAAAGTNVALRTGTGAAPANGVAVTGNATPAGTFGPIHASSASNQTPFAINSGRIGGFTIGTQIWVDLAFDTTNVADAAGLANLIVRIQETQ